MQMKPIFRIAFVFILVIAVVCAGIYTFMELRSNEKIYHADLFTLVPAESNVLFSFANPRELSSGFPMGLLPENSYLKIAASLYSLPLNISVPGTDNLIIAYSGDVGLILYRTSPSTVLQWEKQQSESGFFPFLSKKEKFNHIEYQVSLTSDDRFFCYTYYGGAFIGSFSKNMLCKALSMISSSENLYTDSSFRAYKNLLKSSALVSCFFKQESWYALDVVPDKVGYKLNGCLLPEYCSSTLYQSLSVTSAEKKDFHPELIPGKASLVVHLNSDSIFFDDVWHIGKLIQKHASGNVSFCVEENSKSCCRTVIAPLKNKYRFFEELCHELPEKPQENLCVWNKNQENIVYRIYRLPSEFQFPSISNLFSGEGLSYFTFYKNNLLIGSSVDELKKYWEEIHSGRTFAENPLMNVYQKCVNGDASVFMFLFASNGVCKDKIFPEYIYLKSTYDYFIQYIPGKKLIYYNVFLMDSNN